MANPNDQFVLPQKADPPEYMTALSKTHGEVSGFEKAVVACRGSVRTLIVEAVASVVIALTTVTHTNTKSAAIWLVVVWTTLALRALCCHSLTLAGSGTERLTIWRWTLWLAMAFSAAVWGSALFFLSLEGSSPADAALVVEILAVIVLGSALVSVDLTFAVGYFSFGFAALTASIRFTPGVDAILAGGEAMGAVAIALTLIVFVRSLVAESRELRNAFNDAQRYARAAIEAKSNFIANMSHELRTPLNAIIGFSEIIQSQTFGPVGDPKYAGYVKDIRDSGRHLLAVINDILDLSKIEAGRMELSDETVDVADVIERCRQLMSIAAEKAGVSLVSNVPQEPVLLRADERSLKQIILNLLSNAVKFTPLKGSVCVKLGVHASGVEIAVIDSGIGIAPEDIAVVMEPFGQVDTSLSRRFEGTGLGLPLVKSLTELQDGRFVLESEPAVGTTARIIFPIERRIVLAGANTGADSSQTNRLHGAVA